MTKKAYRVTFENTWSSAHRVVKIVVTSNIEKSISRVRKGLILQGSFSKMAGVNTKKYLTLVEVELLGTATIHP